MEASDDASSLQHGGTMIDATCCAEFRNRSGLANLLPACE
jgi:hypothetical protein